MESRSLLKKLLVTPDLEQLVDAMPKPVGSLDYDPWGFNYDTAKVALGAFRFLYEKYFRVEAVGLEHIPAEGRCLVIGNHSGQVPVDGALVGYALATNPHGPRAARAMVERWFPTVPFLGNLLNQVGAVVGEPGNCSRMLDAEEAVIVFPEGVRGAGKPWGKRYQLQRFGNGFMHLAIDKQAPVIPVGIVGCEEMMPSLANVKPLARALGLPYFPLALPVPLPSRVVLVFGEPLHFGPAQDESAITANVDRVKQEIARLVRHGRSLRDGGA